MSREVRSFSWFWLGMGIRTDCACHMVGAAVRSPAASAKSFESLESSHRGHGHGHGRGGRAPVVAAPRMLARTGERFKFRVPVCALAPPSPTLGVNVNTSTNAKRASLSRPKDLEVRLLSGRPLPKFFRVNLDGVPSGVGDAGRRVVELWGVPVRADCGEYEVGVYAKEGGERVGRVLVEVVERKSG